MRTSLGRILLTRTSLERTYIQRTYIQRTYERQISPGQAFVKIRGFHNRFVVASAVLKHRAMSSSTFLLPFSTAG